MNETRIFYVLQDKNNGNYVKNGGVTTSLKDARLYENIKSAEFKAKQFSSDGDLCVVKVVTAKLSVEKTK